MNLLVTNTRNGQAYCAIRSLRKHAAKIVTTVYGNNRLAARLAPAALSRFVDRVYHVPSVIEDWRSGKIADGHNETVGRYIRAILRICEEEKIDAVFPSWDPQMCAFSINKREFTERGIVIPVPDWPVLAKLIDKYELMKQTAAAGFPCPRSFLPGDEGEALEAAQELGFPVVVKPRFSSGSRGTCLARNKEELIATLSKLVPTYGMPMVQEYIDGGNAGLINLIVVLDRGYRLCAFHSRRVVRSFSGRFTSATSAEVCMHDPALAERAARLLRTLGYWGHAAFQLQRDPRDGVEKLLEINCRLSYRAWCEAEIGHNLPLLALQVERGEEIAPANPCQQEGLFVYPIEDSLGRLIRAIGSGLRASAVSRSGKTNSASTTIFNDWYFKSIFSDPLHALAWYGTRLLSIAQELRRPAIEAQHAKDGASSPTQQPSNC